MRKRRDLTTNYTHIVHYYSYQHASIGKSALYLCILCELLEQRPFPNASPSRPCCALVCHTTPLSARQRHTVPRPMEWISSDVEHTAVLCCNMEAVRSNADSYSVELKATCLSVLLVYLKGFVLGCSKEKSQMTLTFIISHRGKDCIQVSSIECISSFFEKTSKGNEKQLTNLNPLLGYFFR